MRKAFHFLMTALLLVIFGISNAQTTQWYGYAQSSFGGETWQNKFISFTAQDINTIQTVSETFPEIYAAAYVDGYVWFVTKTERNLCKAPFNLETNTIGDYEIVVAPLQQYNLVIDMAYNPLEGMLYYLCSDSQANMNLKRSSLANPSEVESLGNFSQKLWTLAINSQGQAYGVAYEEGNLYQIDLANATTTLVGSTGHDVWYTQSMAFDLDTDELYWAQLSSVADHGFYRVNTATGEATPLGEIGGTGAELTGLFMVPENVTPAPEIISEIYVEGFTEPVWGEHPDYELEVNPEAPYTIAHISWHRYVSYDDHVLEPEEYFDLEDVNYYLFVLLSPKEGFIFDEHPMVCFNNDNSVFNYGAFTDNDYRVYTIDYQVTNPVGIAEQTMDDLEGQPVNVYDMTGRLVFQGCYNEHRCFEGLKPGIYVVNIAGRSLKVMIK